MGKILERAEHEIMTAEDGDEGLQVARIDHPDAKPHHTLAREAMVIVDHNGYHWGEMVLLRRLLGAWPQP